MPVQVVWGASEEPAALVGLAVKVITGQRAWGAPVASVERVVRVVSVARVETPVAFC